jgi:hypothetical protein
MDMPTIARKRARLRELAASDLTIKQVMAVFGVTSTTPIRNLIERGKLSADKATGEWCIAAESVDRYLTEINNQYSREFLKK